MKLLCTILLVIVALTIEAQVKVRGYYRKNGTYVQPHTRSNPDGNPYNNYSYPGNYNPNTGKVSTGNPNTYIDNYYNKNNAPKSSKDVWINGYYKSDGTYVQGHWRSTSISNSSDKSSFHSDTNNYIGKVATEKPDITLKSYYVTSNILSVRSGPSTNYSIMTILNYGDNIEVVENYNKNWKKVKVSYFDYSSYTTKYETGYVYSSYIATSNLLYTNSNYYSTSLSSSKDLSNLQSYVPSSYVNTTTLNVRSGASTNFPVITTLSQGDKVEIVGIVSSNWKKIKATYYDANSWSYKTATGYVFSPYLSDTNPTYSSSNDPSKFQTDYDKINSSDYLSNSSYPYGNNSGKITFWTDCGTDGEILIYLDNIYIGALTKYFSDGSVPECSDIRVLSTTKRAGVYPIFAKGTTLKWKGYITVTEDKCHLQKLQK